MCQNMRKKSHFFLNFCIKIMKVNVNINFVDFGVKILKNISQNLYKNLHIFLKIFNIYFASFSKITEINVRKCYIFC